MGAARTTFPATLASPGATATTWTYSWNAPGNGQFRAEVDARDTVGQSSPVAGADFDLTDAPPGVAWSTPGDGATVTSSPVALTGSATDDVGVTAVELAFQDTGSGQWFQADGTWGAARVEFDAALGSPGATATTWSYSWTPRRLRLLPRRGAIDRHGHVDLGHRRASVHLPRRRALGGDLRADSGSGVVELVHSRDRHCDRRCRRRGGEGVGAEPHLRALAPDRRHVGCDARRDRHVARQPGRHHDDLVVDLRAPRLRRLPGRGARDRQRRTDELDRRRGLHLAGRRADGRHRHPDPRPGRRDPARSPSRAARPTTAGSRR